MWSSSSLEEYRHVESKVPRVRIHVFKILGADLGISGLLEWASWSQCDYLSSWACKIVPEKLRCVEVAVAGQRCSAFTRARGVTQPSPVQGLGQVGQCCHPVYLSHLHRGGGAYCWWGVERRWYSWSGHKVTMYPPKTSLKIHLIRANMNLQLGVNSLYTKRGFK